MRRCGEGSLDRRAVAGQPFEAQIARRLRRQFEGTGGPRGGGIGHRRQWLIVDGDKLGGVERLVAGLRDDQRHRLAGIADLAVGEERLRRKQKALACLGVGLGGGQ